MIRLPSIIGTKAKSSYKRRASRLTPLGSRLSNTVEIGHPAEVISALAERLACDQIVMGTHGRTALVELLVGSITLKVLHLAVAPVLLVK